jgi:hypothetical protein
MELIRFLELEMSLANTLLVIQLLNLIQYLKANTQLLNLRQPKQLLSFHLDPRKETWRFQLEHFLVNMQILDTMQTKVISFTKKWKNQLTEAQYV